MAKHRRVCILSIEEGEALRRGDRLNHGNHYHSKPEEALALLSDSEHRPWLNTVAFKPMAVRAKLPNGKFSGRHIIQIIEFHWMASPSGNTGVSVMQLYPTKRYA